MRSQYQYAQSRRGIGRLEIIVAVVVVVIVASVAIALLMKGKQDGEGGAPGANNMSPEDALKMHRSNLMSVRNNLKQLGLACQNHNDTFKTFPPLFFSN